MSFEQVKLTNGADPLVVMLASPTCGPCKMMKPILDKLRQQLCFEFVQLQAADEAELLRHQDIRGVPTLLVLQNGVITAKSTGFKTEKELKAWLDESKVTQDRLQW